MNKAVLIIDDDRSERRLISNILRRSADLNALEAENGKDGLRLLDKDSDDAIKLIILDLNMQIMDGMETLELIKKTKPHIPVIVLTGDATMENAIKAMRMGAVDFLSKPVESARLDISARNALKISLMTKEITRLKRKTESALGFSDLIGYDAGLAESVAIGKKAAACDLPVLLAGETGTGKEMFANAIHGESQRVGHPFIAVNCGAIPENLVESILFGHEKGAFTGATHKTIGKFQEASGGAIFLDEIGELPLDAQVKLLRVLQQKEVQPVGAAKPTPIDVRIISATNRNLTEDVKQGRFREDLYFRLNVLFIELPPLRARKDDIPFLARHFIDQFCVNHQALPKEISDQSILKLNNHAWPGNVRELQNVVSRAMALTDATLLKPDDFAFLRSISNDAPIISDIGIAPTRPDGVFKNFKELEYEIVTLALAHHKNNISQTARVLGIAKSTLYAKLHNLADRQSA